jgi:regulator of sigma D
VIDDPFAPQPREALKARATEWTTALPGVPPRLQQHGAQPPSADGWRLFCQEVVEPSGSFQLDFWDRVLRDLTERGRIIDEAAGLYRRLVATTVEMLDETRTIERRLSERGARDPRDRPFDPELADRFLRLQQLFRQQDDLVGRLAESCRRHWNGPEDG